LPVALVARPCRTDLVQLERAAAPFSCDGFGKLNARQRDDSCSRTGVSVTTEMYRPMRIWLVGKLLKMDQHVQVAPDRNSLRCLFTRDTAASSDESPAARVDATAVNAKSVEFAVVGTTEVACTGQTLPKGESSRIGLSPGRSHSATCRETTVTGRFRPIQILTASSVRNEAVGSGTFAPSRESAANVLPKFATHT
jgi:hypothetical protein